jgi:hypothetical protein
MCNVDTNVSRTIALFWLLPPSPLRCTALHPLLDCTVSDSEPRISNLISSAACASERVSGCIVAVSFVCAVGSGVGSRFLPPLGRSRGRARAARRTAPQPSSPERARAHEGGAARRASKAHHGRGRSSGIRRCRFVYARVGLPSLTSARCRCRSFASPAARPATCSRSEAPPPKHQRPTTTMEHDEEEVDYDAEEQAHGPHAHATTSEQGRERVALLQVLTSPCCLRQSWSWRSPRQSHRRQRISRRKSARRHRPSLHQQWQQLPARQQQLPRPPPSPQLQPPAEAPSRLGRSIAVRMRHATLVVVVRVRMHRRSEATVLRRLPTRADTIRASRTSATVDRHQDGSHAVDRRRETSHRDMDKVSNAAGEKTGRDPSTDEPVSPECARSRQGRPSLPLIGSTGGRSGRLRLSLPSACWSSV